MINNTAPYIEIGWIVNIRVPIYVFSGNGYTITILKLFGAAFWFNKFNYYLDTAAKVYNNELFMYGCVNVYAIVDKLIFLFISQYSFKTIKHQQLKSCRYL